MVKNIVRVLTLVFAFCILASAASSYAGTISGSVKGISPLSGRYIIIKQAGTPGALGKAYPTDSKGNFTLPVLSATGQYIISPEAISGYTVYPASYTVTITSPSQVVTGKNFGFSAIAPKITSISPKSGVVGTSVTITGTNFGKTAVVTFNGKTAPMFSMTSNYINVAVPLGVPTGSVSIVVTQNGQQSNTVIFVVSPY